MRSKGLRSKGEGCPCGCTCSEKSEQEHAHVDALERSYQSRPRTMFLYM